MKKINKMIDKMIEDIEKSKEILAFEILKKALEKVETKRINN